MSTYQRGDLVWAEIKGQKVAATVLVANLTKGYQVELEQVNPFHPEQILRQIYPRWIPYHKLTGRERRVRS